MKTKRGLFSLRQLLYAFIAGLLLGISALALILVYEPLRRSPLETSPFRVSEIAEYDGVTEIEPPQSIPRSPLLNHHGAAADLDDFAGKYVLLTFGFTHCPDICPLTLNDYRQAQKLLGESANRIHFVFVSVDGARDSPEALRAYFNFRELYRVIGLTGAEAQVRAFGAPFGLSIEISEQETGGNYLVNHTAGSFLLDPEGRWIRRYQFGLPPERIAADLRTLLAA